MNSKTKQFRASLILLLAFTLFPTPSHAEDLATSTPPVETVTIIEATTETAALSTTPVITLDDSLLAELGSTSTSTDTLPVIQDTATTTPETGSSTPPILEPSTTIRLKVATNDTLLYNKDIAIHACLNSQSGTTTSINALCAVEQASVESGWSIAKTWYSFGVSLDGINEYVSDFVNNKFWLWFGGSSANIEPGDTGLDGKTLAVNETILVTYNTAPLRLRLTTTTPQVDQSTTLIGEVFDTDTWSWATTTGLVLNSNGTDIATSTNGLFEFTPTTASPNSLFIHKTGLVTSEPVTLTALPAPEPSTTIRLKVAANDTLLYNKDIAVFACQNSETGTTTTINAFCAVKQAAEEMAWSIAKTWYSFGVSLDGINEFVSDFVNNKFWLWFNTSPGSINSGATGLDSHLLTTGETLLLTYNTAPLTLVASTLTPDVFATTTLSLSLFDTNTWSLGTATDAVVNINGVDIATSTGVFDFIPSTTTPYTIFIHKEGLVSSEPLVLTPILATTLATTTEPIATTTEPATSGGGFVHNKMNVDQAIQFLVSKQLPDGSYGSDLYTDWVAVAFGAYKGNNPAKEKLKNYIASHPLPPGSSLTDYERRVMALLSLGINPSIAGGVNHIQEITESHDGLQFGDPLLLNDDVFALLTLLHSGYNTTDPMLIKSVGYIVAGQSSDGSWNGVDSTSATMQALSSFSNIPEAVNAVIRGKNYLKTRQQVGGGFENSFATSWVIQALASLIPDENIENSWSYAGKTPHDFLASTQQTDGGLETMSSDTNSRVWATAYGIPATLESSWADIFTSNVTSNTVSVSTQYNGTGEVTLGTASTTIRTPIASTTLAIASTTPITLQIAVTSTSTVKMAIATTSTFLSTTTSTGTVRNIKKPTTIQNTKLVIKEPGAINQTTTDSKIVKAKRGILSRLGLSIKDFFGTLYLGLGKIFGL